MNLDFLLMQKIKNGDPEAAEQFIKKYYAAIYQYCFLHIHSQHDAEDLTQETFTRFFESVMDCYNAGKAKNYLYCIAGNIIKNFYKKKRDIPMEELPEIPDQHMDAVEIRLDIEQAVDQLPEELKEVTILFYFQNFRQREIAELLNIKLSLVKYHIGQAKKILAEFLIQ